MEDNKQITQPVVTTDTGNTEDKTVGKTYTQTDMDNLAGKIRGEEKAKNERAHAKALLRKSGIKESC